MQPHPPQLPTDAPLSPAPKNLKKTAWLLLLAIAVVATLIAFILPKKQVESRNAPTTTQHRTESTGYDNPTRWTVGGLPANPRE